MVNDSISYSILQFLGLARLASPSVLCDFRDVFDPARIRSLLAGRRPPPVDGTAADPDD